MAHVIVAFADARSFTGGAGEFDVPATTVGKLLAALEARYPGLGDFAERRCALAIDGEIHQDAFAESLGPDAEVCLIPRIGGG